MPEANDNVNSSLLSDSDESQSETIEGEIGGYKKTESSKPKLDEILKKFFNSQRTSRKVADAEGCNKQKKYIKQFSEALSRSFRCRTYESVAEVGSSSEGDSPSRNNCKDGGVAGLHRSSTNGTCEGVKPLVNESEIKELNCQNSGRGNKSKFKFLKLGRKKSSRIHSDGTGVPSSCGAGELPLTVSQENFKDSGPVRQQLKKYESAFSEPEFDRIQARQRHETDELIQGITGNSLRRSFSAESKGTSKEKSQSEIKNSLKFSFGNLILPRLHSGSFIIKNKGDTNVKFAELKPDTELIVDTTPTGLRISSPSLLSGGQAVFDEFADSFKPLVVDVDDPIVLDELPEGVTIPESSIFRQPTPRVTDDSSKCSSFLELFPSKNPFSMGDRCFQTYLRHRSGGRLVEPGESEAEVSVNPISKTLCIVRDSSTSNSDFTGNISPRLSFSVDFSSLKRSNSQCAYCSSRNPFASTSSNRNPAQESCSCNRGCTSEDGSSAVASSDYLEADLEIDFNSRVTHVVETHVEDEEETSQTQQCEDPSRSI